MVGAWIASTVTFSGVAFHPSRFLPKWDIFCPYHLELVSSLIPCSIVNAPRPERMGVRNISLTRKNLSPFQCDEASSLIIVQCRPREMSDRTLYSRNHLSWEKPLEIKWRLVEQNVLIWMARIRAMKSDFNNGFCHCLKLFLDCVIEAWREDDKICSSVSSGRKDL